MTTQTPDLLGVADELYGLTLPEFTPTRDARAKELKASDAQLAARVKGLRKPSMAAWVVNLLVRQESEQVAQVLQVGAALREAQASLAGEELRALTRQRRQLTAAVTTRARALAAENGQKVTPAVSDQVEATLTAAMVDEDCAAAVRSGLLVAALASTGVEAVELGAAVAVPDALGFSASPRQARAEQPTGRPELHVVPDPDADRKALAAARARLDETEEEVARATESLGVRGHRRGRARGPQPAGPGRDRRAPAPDRGARDEPRGGRRRARRRRGRPRRGRGVARRRHEGAGRRGRRPGRRWSSRDR